MVSWNSIPGGFAYVCQSKWLGVIAIKIESTQINFFQEPIDGLLLFKCRSRRRRVVGS